MRKCIDYVTLDRKISFVYIYAYADRVYICITIILWESTSPTGFNKK